LFEIAYVQKLKMGGEVLTDYQKYRGRCRELAEKECENNPNLELIRGYYHCPIWGTQQHWWCKNKVTNEIVDPTKRQFPSKGVGEYEEFNGMVTCAECGKMEYEKVAMEQWHIMGNYICCSMECCGKLVGVPIG